MQFLPMSHAAIGAGGAKSSALLIAGASLVWTVVSLRIKTIEPGDAPMRRASSACDMPLRASAALISAFQASPTWKNGPLGRGCFVRLEPVCLGRPAPFRSVFGIPPFSTSEAGPSSTSE